MLKKIYISDKLVSFKKRERKIFCKKQLFKNQRKVQNVVSYYTTQFIKFVISECVLSVIKS